MRENHYYLPQSHVRGDPQILQSTQIGLFRHGSAFLILVLGSDMPQLIRPQNFWPGDPFILIKMTEDREEHFWGASSLSTFY